MVLKVGPTTLVLFSDAPDDVTVMDLHTPRHHRKKGAARHALQIFLDEADRRDATVRLLASPLDTSTSLRKLTALYESLGFARTGTLDHRTGHPFMLRLPSARKRP